MRSVGVMATTLSTAPAAIPAMMPRPVESLPSASASCALMESKVRKRTPALPAVPWEPRKQNQFLSPVLSIMYHKYGDVAPPLYGRPFRKGQGSGEAGLTYEDEGRTARVNGPEAIGARREHEGREGAPGGGNGRRRRGGRSLL